MHSGELTPVQLDGISRHSLGLGIWYHFVDQRFIRYRYHISSLGQGFPSDFSFGGTPLKIMSERYSLASSVQPTVHRLSSKPEIAYH